jgi:ABC-type phosphate transport system substrate-binding protein
MNDEFLHKIRIEPPPRFISTLKARLDRQRDLRRTKWSWFRNALIVSAVGASGWAAGVMVMNSIRDRTTSRIITNSTQSPVDNAHDAQPQAPRASTRSFADPAPNAGSMTPESAAYPDGNLSSTAGITVPHAPTSSTGIIPEGMRILGPSSLSLSLKEATRILNLSRPFSEPAFSISGSDSAIAALCNSSQASDHPFGAVAGTADAVGANRRISNEELKRCNSNGIKHVAEINLGYEAIVLARSKLYAAPKLTARDLFLALARQIPDPEQPQRLIANTNISWSQVNPALPAEPIDISGPPLGGDSATAFRELLLEPGCSTFASLASLKEKDRVRYDDVCKDIRTDGIYHGLGRDLFGQLEAHPEALALVDFRFFAANSARLIGVAIEGVEPTSASVYSGSYPGSRALYVYVNVARTLVIPRMRDFIYALQDSILYGPGSTTLIAGTEADRRESRQAALVLADIKL